MFSDALGGGRAVDERHRVVDLHGSVPSSSTSIGYCGNT